MLIGDPAQPGSSQIKRFVPADALPAGIGIALRPGALQGIEQPVWVIDQLRGCPPLGAKGPTGWVRRIRFKGNETAIFNLGDRATTRDTQGAVTLNLLG